MTDHYEALGVARDATAEQIKAAYRRESSKAHPDRQGGSVERQQQVNDAYAVIGDPAKRKAYDNGEAVGPDQLKQKGIAIVIGIFDQMIDRQDPGPARATIMGLLRDADRQLRKAISDGERSAKKAERWANGLKPKAGKDAVDLFRMHAERKRELIAERLREIRGELEANTAAMTLMDDYEDGIRPSFDGTNSYINRVMFGADLGMTAEEAGRLIGGPDPSRW